MYVCMYVSKERKVKIQREEVEETIHRMLFLNEVEGSDAEQGRRIIF